MKTGFKTSEFWVAIVTAAVALLNGLFDLGLDGEEMVGIFGPAVAYIGGRALTKFGGSEKK